MKQELTIIEILSTHRMAVDKYNDGEITINQYKDIFDKLETYLLKKEVAIVRAKFIRVRSELHNRLGRELDINNRLLIKYVIELLNEEINLTK